MKRFDFNLPKKPEVTKPKQGQLCKKRAEANDFWSTSRAVRLGTVSKESCRRHMLAMSKREGISFWLASKMSELWAMNELRGDS